MFIFKFLCIFTLPKKTTEIRENKIRLFSKVKKNTSCLVKFRKQSLQSLLGKSEVLTNPKG